MKRIVIANAFSLNMLEAKYQNLEFSPVEDIREFFALNAHALVESIVGHSDTATVFSDVLGFHVPGRRVTYTMQPGDALIVGQLTGDRLPVGATELPLGATIAWWVIYAADTFRVPGETT